jgi:nuclear pore complex protein Nup98-Nup96
VWEAYELYIAAGLFNSAHELAVLELAPDAVIRRDFDLLKSLFAKIAGHPVSGWHIRGKVFLSLSIPSQSLDLTLAFPSQAFLDYAHIMTRVPDLHDRMQEEDAVPDASDAMELAELVRHIPKLIGILPDILHDRSDPRHKASPAVMISGLIHYLDRIQPLSFVSFLFVVA